MKSVPNKAKVQVLYRCQDLGYIIIWIGLAWVLLYIMTFERHSSCVVMQVSC
jgi:cytochrome oxidase assembly protein ShyY1